MLFPTSHLSMFDHFVGLALKELNAAPNILLESLNDNEIKLCQSINPYGVTGLFLYPLKTQENQRFSEIFRGIEIDHWHEMGEVTSASIPSTNCKT